MNAKEHAHVLAAQHGLSLSVHGWDVYGHFADGRRVRICSGHRISSRELWLRVIVVLKTWQDSPPKLYSLRTPYGVYSGKSLFELFWRYLWDDRERPIEDIT